MPSLQDQFPKEGHCCNLSAQEHRNEKRKWVYHTMVNESAVRKNETVPGPSRGKKVETITASEVRETGGDKQSVMSLVGGI